MITPCRQRPYRSPWIGQLMAGGGCERPTAENSVAPLNPRLASPHGGDGLRQGEILGVSELLGVGSQAG
jgi:hypothetical protein